MNDAKIGTKYGNYIIESDIYIENKIKKVIVKCSCGRERVCHVGNLHKLNKCSKCYGNSKSLIKVGLKNKNGIEVFKILDGGKIIIKCLCGKTKTILRTSFRNLKSCSCRDINKRGAEHHAFKGFGDMPASIFHRVKNGAISRNIEFQISIEYMYKIFHKQNRKCALTGIPLLISSYANKGNASLDRIDNTKGYIEGNVWWIDKEINMMKNCHSVDKFKRLCSLVSEYKNESNI